MQWLSWHTLLPKVDFKEFFSYRTPTAGWDKNQYSSTLYFDCLFTIVLLFLKVSPLGFLFWNFPLLDFLLLDLEPLFFIVHINDLPGEISKDSSIALYADDSKMYRVINTQDDLSSFQSDIK